MQQQHIQKCRILQQNKEIKIKNKIGKMPVLRENNKKEIRKQILN